MRRWLTSLAALMCAWTLMTSTSSAALLLYGTSMSGLQEAPVNNSSGSGTVLVNIDTSLHTMRVRATFTGLTGNSTAAHIHGPTPVPGGTAGVATTTPSFVGFPLGVTSGSMDQTYDLTLTSSYNGTFVTANGGTAAGAELALLNSLAAGTSYFNIHSTSFAAGEIRGFLIANVPEPSSMLLLGGFIAGAGVRFYRRRTNAKPLS